MEEVDTGYIFVATTEWIHRSSISLFLRGGQIGYAFRNASFVRITGMKRSAYVRCFEELLCIGKNEGAILENEPLALSKIQAYQKRAKAIKLL